MVARFKSDRDEQYTEFIDKCTDFEAEIAKETAAQHFTYAELEENDVDLKKLQIGWKRYASWTSTAPPEPKKPSNDSSSARRYWIPTRNAFSKRTKKTAD